MVQEEFLNEKSAFWIFVLIFYAVNNCVEMVSEQDTAGTKADSDCLKKGMVFHTLHRKF
jgi:hypothetical protein